MGFGPRRPRAVVFAGGLCVTLGHLLNLLSLGFLLYHTGIIITLPVVL